MRNLPKRFPQERSRIGVRIRNRVLQMLGATSLFSVVAAAQGAARPELRLGIGTFLSNDRGWNYGEPIEMFATIARRAGRVDVEAGASFSKSFARFAKPAVYPSPPGAYRDGFRVRLGLRVPSSSRGALSALVGAELVRNLTEGEARTTTTAGAMGVGLNFGPAKRGSIDLRYVRFAKQLGSSRGILPLTLAWQL